MSRILLHFDPADSPFEAQVVKPNVSFILIICE